MRCWFCTSGDVRGITLDSFLLGEARRSDWSPWLWSTTFCTRLRSVLSWLISCEQESCDGLGKISLSDSSWSDVSATTDADERGVIGIIKVKQLPLPGPSDLTETLPEHASIIMLTIFSPRPIPSSFVFAVLWSLPKRVNNFGMSYAGIPFPVSLT